MFEPFNNSTFKCLPIDDLEEGKQYLIRTCVRKRYITKVGTFIGLSKYSYYGYFDVRMPVSGFLRFSFNETSYFYDFVSQKYKIQNAMELRAVNKILRRIIGDESFTY
uniref:Uncharacterized protein n=1 Tax=viral metagenome TaxID=1070528 RepID=A0A6C0EU19_9ZZZZ